MVGKQSGRGCRGVGAGRRRGFTLLEVIVSLGAVLVVSLGLVAIFGAIGDTVSGGRRVSLLNTYAGLLERQMARDFGAMTRDGFLVIRQQAVDVDGDGEVDQTIFDPLAQDDAVALFRGQPRSERRARRIDEIMFFARGDFSSQREPLHPSVRPGSGVARIYYGHGQRQRVPAGVSPGELPYFVPQIDDPNQDAGARLGVAAASGPENPNEFASQWLLLRHVTLLAQPQTAGRTLPPSTEVYDVLPEAMADGEFQIALQPAASSLFRSLARAWDPSAGVVSARVDLPPGTSGGAGWAGSAQPPTFASGLVDIATTDLAEIRAVVELSAAVNAAPYSSTLPFLPGNVPLGVGGYPAPVLQGPFAMVRTINLSGSPGAPRAGGTNRALYFAHQWMSDAMPTESRQDIGDYPLAYQVASEPLATRMRAEAGATDLLAAFTRESEPPFPPYRNDPLERATGVTDQRMLASSVLVPGCTEFVVEWSFGLVAEAPPGTPGAGELVWHGPRRGLDGNGDGVFTPGTNGDRLLSRPYLPPGTLTSTLVPTNEAPGGLGGAWGVTANLIYGFVPTGLESSLTSYFGWADPTYDGDLDGDGVAGEPTDGVPGVTVPWRWPTLIRVTVTLADPVDPGIESTFQFIFRTPGNPTAN